MSAIKNKIDFVAFISASNCNPNGDPLNGNRPRSDYEGFGEISDVCIKRKIRNRMQDMGQNVFVQSSDRSADGCKSLKERFDNSGIKDTKDQDEKAKKACEKWIDIRAFGQVLAFKGDKGEGDSIPVRGPVTIRQAVSCSPIDVNSMQITKSVNGNPSDKGDKKAADTMGTKHFVTYGLYKMMGSVNVQLAEKTGFSEEDAEILKKCIQTLFENDASSARPDGSMEIVRFYWWEHNSKDGQYPSAKVHRSVKAVLKPGVEFPHSAEDYEFTEEKLPGLEPYRYIG